jgi:hypothetical protein
VADLDGDSLDEVQVIFRDSYHAYSFSRDSLISQDHQAYFGGTAGILTANLDADPEPEVLLKDLGGRMWLKENALDTGFVVVDTIPEIGGGYLGAPGATMFLRDLNGDGYKDVIVSQLTEYFQYTGRYYETILYHTGDVGAYDLHNNQFLWKYSTPDWIIPPHVPSAQYSTCFDRDGSGRIAVVTWGINDHWWYERNSQDIWVNRYTAKEDLSVFDQSGAQIYFRSSSFEYHVLSGDFVSALPGDEVVIVRYGATTDSLASPNSFGWVMFCLKFVTDTPDVIWAKDCPQPYSNALFWPSGKTDIFALATWSETRLIHSSDGSDAGLITGLKAGVIAHHCRAVASDTTDQIVQAVGNTLYLYQIQEPTDVNEGNPTSIPGCWVLNQNYPNPFNPSTTIAFELLRPMRISLVVYNTVGQVVTILVDSWLPAGPHVVNWNGRNSSGSQVSSGVYLYRLEADGVTPAKKMMLLK